MHKKSPRSSVGGIRYLKPSPELVDLELDARFSGRVVEDEFERLPGSFQINGSEVIGQQRYSPHDSDPYGARETNPMYGLIPLRRGGREAAGGFRSFRTGTRPVLSTFRGEFACRAMAAEDRERA